jgi:hypothetical protein
MKNAMLAPIFIFFLYIIILFLDFGGSLTYTSDGDTLQNIMGVIIPFAMLFILLTNAKKLAVTFSGDMGKAVQGLVGTVGGMALGGAALGTAALGRSLIGRTAASASNFAANKTEFDAHKATFDQKLSAWQTSDKTTRGEKPTWKDYKKDNTNIKTGSIKEKLLDNSIMLSLGRKVNESQEKTKEIDHARHEIDQIKEKAGLAGVNEANLSSIERKKIESTFAKEKKSEIEGEVRRGYDSKGKPISLDGGTTNIQSESSYKASQRGRISEDVKNDPESLKNKDTEKVITGTKIEKRADSSGIIRDVEVPIEEIKVTEQGRKKIEDQLNQEFSIAMKDAVEKLSKDRFNHLKQESTEKINPAMRMMSRSTSGSYDVRNIPSSTDKREGFGTKATLGLIAAVSTGIRAVLKNGLNVNDIGASQRSIGKDLGDVIKSALKGAKIDVKIGGDAGGGHGGGDKKAHGGGGHGGGGHH